MVDSKKRKKEFVFICPSRDYVGHIVLSKLIDLIKHKLRNFSLKKNAGWKQYIISGHNTSLWNFCDPKLKHVNKNSNDSI